MAQATLSNRVGETTIIEGTGTLNLLGISRNTFRTFVSGCGSGSTVYYTVVHRTLGEWESGIGVVTAGSPDTLTRATVLDNHLGTTAKVVFSSGTKDVFLDIPSQRRVVLDSDDGTRLTLENLTVAQAISGSVTGNAATATKLATARAINGVDFDGTAPITVAAAAGTLTGTGLNATVVSSSLTSVGTLTSLTVSGLVTITQGTANTGIIASTGYSLTGSDATSMVSLAGVLNTTGTPTVFSLAVTNTASNAASRDSDGSSKKSLHARAYRSFSFAI